MICICIPILKHLNRPIGAAPMKRPETKSISIAAPRQTVLEFVGDPRNLPRWAPAFAPTIRPDGDAWVVGEVGSENAPRIIVRMSEEHGTVDFLAAGLPAGVELGAFSRVVANDDGSEYFFTLFFPEDATEDAIAKQMAVVEQELETVKSTCERAPA